MISHEGALWLVRDPVDMRKGIEGLSAMVRLSLERNPCTEGAFIFRNRAGNRMKLLLWDGTGVWICQRRLHQGRFSWPMEGDRVFTLGHDEWEWLFRGADWQRLHARPSAAWEE